jgi:hypothetical protein
MGYIKTFIINKRFKKIFKLFLIIALLIILTTLMYSLFNKPSIENLEDENATAKNNDENATAKNNDENATAKNNDENAKYEKENGIDKSKSRIECSFVTSQINKHRDHPFAVKNGDWDTLVNKYSGNPRISMRTVNIDNISTIVDTKQFVFVHSNFPMVIMSIFLTDKRITNKQIDNFRLTLVRLTHSQLSYDNVDKTIELLIKYFL